MMWRASSAAIGLMWADLIERIRRYSFLVILGLTVLAGYSMIPAADASYVSFAVAGQRALYNSAWVGTIFGTVAATMITLLGFFLIRKSVVRDYRTRVGQVIAATSVSNFTYLLGKTMSNLAVLVVVMIVLSLVAPIMQLIRAESPELNLMSIWLPLWAMGLPCLAVVAATATLFDTVRLLRGGVGNVVFVALWTWQIIWSVGRQFSLEGDISASNDLVGLSHTMASLKAMLIAGGVDLTKGITDLYQPVGDMKVGVYLWSGLDWSAEMLAGRLVWIALALGIVLVATIPFDRFDPAKWRLFIPKPAVGSQVTEALPTVAIPAEHSIGVDLTGLDGGRCNMRFFTIFVTELKLMLRGQPWWWFVVALGLVIANPLYSGEPSERILTPLSWLWPLFVWSAMGAREHVFQTDRMIFPISKLSRRQVPALWLAGSAVAAITGLGTFIRLLVAAEWFMLTGWITGAIFIPALALALGIWSKGRRSFETIYLTLWFFGVGGRIAWLDFTGVGPIAPDSFVVVFYGVGTLALLGIAFVGRRLRAA